VKVPFFQSDPGSGLIHLSKYEFKKILKKAGLAATYRIHDLRHTFVSYLLSQNTPPRDVQEIVGHASFSTIVDIYGHLMPGAKREAAKKMDGFFNGMGTV